MRTTMHRIIIVGVIGVLLSGCAAARTDVVLLNPPSRYASLEAKEAVVLTTLDLNRPHEELGVIHVSGVTREGYEGLNDKLRREARRIGADAVIYVRYGTENVLSVIPIFVSIPYDVLTAEGVAVRSR